MWKKQKRVDIINLKVWDNIPLNIMDNTLLSIHKGDSMEYYLDEYEFELPNM